VGGDRRDRVSAAVRIHLRGAAITLFAYGEEDAYLRETQAAVELFLDGTGKLPVRIPLIRMRVVALRLRVGAADAAVRTTSRA
jgi:hypothetical protein